MRFPGATALVMFSVAGGGELHQTLQNQSAGICAQNTHLTNSCPFAMATNELTPQLRSYSSDSDNYIIARNSDLNGEFGTLPNCLELTSVQNTGLSLLIQNDLMSVFGCDDSFLDADRLWEHFVPLESQKEIITSYLSSNSKIIHFLLDTTHDLQGRFNAKVLYLGASVSPDHPEDSYLKVWVPTPDSPSDAFSKLSDFEERWWKTIPEEIARQISVDVTFI